MNELENKFYEYLIKNHPKAPDWYKTIAKDLAEIAEKEICKPIVYRGIPLTDDELKTFRNFKQLEKQLADIK